MSVLCVSSASSGERRIPLGAITIIGRADDSDVFFPDRALSRHHAEIRRQAGAYHLVDLGSTNGTFLNGGRVDEPAALRNGDVIRVGENVMTFEETAADPAAERVSFVGLQAFAVRDLFGRVNKPTLDVTELVAQNKVLGVVSRATGALVDHCGIEAVFERILDLISEAVAPERAAVLLLEGAQPVVKASRSGPQASPIRSVSSAIAQRVIDGEVALLLPDVLEDPLLRTRESVADVGMRTAMCAPLWFTPKGGAAPKTLGLVYVDSRPPAAAFTETDLQVLTVLANVAAAKIETARLFEESLEKQRLEDDIRIAQEIQATLLPRVPPSVPGHSVAGKTRSSRAVGGDYYDFAYDGERLTFCLGDVSGKGTGAAMLMTALKAAVRGVWRQSDLAAAFRTINGTFHQCVPEDKYATFVLARLDVASGRLTFVNAAHNPPLIVRANGDVDTLPVTGTILGTFEDAAFEQGHATLSTGDTLVMFSDGISDNWVDAARADEALVATVQGVEGRHAAATVAAIYGLVDGFGRARVNDDATLVVVHRQT